MAIKAFLEQRQGHIVQSGIPQCSRPTIPGVMSQRACTYYGARWVLAPIKNSIHIVHAPSDCAYYGQNVRKKNYLILSTDMNEKDVVFGAEEKLEKCIEQAAEVFAQSSLIFVYSTCTSSQIGEDIKLVAQRVKNKVQQPVIPVEVPGFGGYSQSTGHHVAQKAIISYLLEYSRKETTHPFSVNIIGEYNVSGESRVIKKLLERIGVEVICIYTGDCDAELMKKSTGAALNLLVCKSSGLLLAQFMREKYSIPFIDVSFYGLKNTINSLKKVAEFFGIENKVASVVFEESKKIKDRVEEYRRKIFGKKAIVLLGGSRIGFMMSAFKEAGLEVCVCGSQFGCATDYEAARLELSTALFIDDFNCAEIEEILLRVKPDVFIGGTREWYLAHKFGVPFFVLPQETKPYACFEGFVNMCEDLCKEIYAPVWRLIKNGKQIAGSSVF